MREYLDPARYQYREFFLLVDALFEGKPGAYCPYIFVDNDAAIARGWSQELSETFRAGFSDPLLRSYRKKRVRPLQQGSKFAGSLTASGHRLADGLVTLKEPVKDLTVLKQPSIVNLLHTPRLAANMRDKPAVHELVENVPHDVKIEQAWIGDGSLSLPVCRGEEISDLVPIRCGRGIRASLAYIVDDLKTLKDLR